MHDMGEFRVWRRLAIKSKFCKNLKKYCISNVLTIHNEDLHMCIGCILIMFASFKSPLHLSFLMTHFLFPTTPPPPHPLSFLVTHWVSLELLTVWIRGYLHEYWNIISGCTIEENLSFLQQLLTVHRHSGKARLCETLSTSISMTRCWWA